MTATEVEKLVRDALTTAGMWQFVDEYASQYLDFPAGLFAEIVLTDGSKLVDAERVVQEVKTSLQKQGIELDVVVRSLWELKEISDPADWTEKEIIDPRAPAGAAWPFVRARAVPIVLISGGATWKVEVDVLLSAIDDIKRRIAGKGLDEAEAVKNVVREFVKLELSRGGVSYWDPIRYPQQEVSEGTLLYLFGQTSAAHSLGIQG
jgi:hypothetical protein